MFENELNRRVKGTIDLRSTKQRLSPGESRPTEEVVELEVAENFIDINLLFNELVTYTSSISAAIGRFKKGNNSEMALREINRHINSAQRLIQKIEHGIEVLQKADGLWVRKKFPDTRSKVEQRIKEAEDLLKELGISTDN